MAAGWSNKLQAVICMQLPGAVGLTETAPLFL